MLCFVLLGCVLFPDSRQLVWARFSLPSWNNCAYGTMLLRLQSLRKRLTTAIKSRVFAVGLMLICSTLCSYRGQNSGTVNLYNSGLPFVSVGLG
jgi:hypothetical protein